MPRSRHARASRNRTARRNSLAVLLARLDRTPLTDAERQLLRAHIDAETGEADVMRAALGRQEAEHRRQLAAAHQAIREAEQDTADHAEELRAYRAVEEQRKTEHRQALARLLAIRSYSRVRPFLAEQPAHLDTASTPEPRP